MESVEGLSERVRYVVEQTEGTHRDFARAVGMEATKLSKSLSGVRRFRAEELASIADRARVDLEWLMHGAGPTPMGRAGGPSPATRRGRPDRRDEQRRLGILEAAWRLIAHRGYYRVRVADVAEACGTSPAAIHYYFPGKHQLLQASLLHCAEAAYSRQGQQLNQLSDARDQLLRLVELLLPATAQIRDEWLIWLQLSSESSLHPELRAAHNDFHLRWRDSVAHVIQRGQRQRVFRDGDAQRMALTFMSLADGLAIKVLTATPGNTVDTMREVLTDFADACIVGGAYS